MGRSWAGSLSFDDMASLSSAAHRRALCKNGDSSGSGLAMPRGPIRQLSPQSSRKAS
jgi:hypothetical protein